MKKIWGCTFWSALSVFLLLVNLAAIKAENFKLWVAGQEVTSENCNDLSKLRGVKAANHFSYNPEKKLLTLSGLILHVDQDLNAIRNEGIEGLKIAAEGKNLLIASSGEALRIDASTEIDGAGYIHIESGEKAGIFLTNNATLTLANLSLFIAGKVAIEGSNNEEKVATRNVSVTLQAQSIATKNIAAFTLERNKISYPVGGRFDRNKKAIVQGNNIANKVELSQYYPLKIAGVDVTPENCKDLASLPSVLAASKFEYDPKENILTMEGVVMEVSDATNAIRNDGVKNLRIEVNGINKLKSTNWTALNLSLTTYICGSGSLDIACEDQAGVYLSNQAKLCISDITLNISGLQGIRGVHATEDIILKNANLTLKGEESAILTIAAFEMQGCKIVEPAGAEYVSSRKTIMAGSVEAKTVTIVSYYELKIAGQDVMLTNCNELHKLLGLSTGNLRYNHGKKLLTLKDLNMTTALDQTIIENIGIEGLQISLEGENVLLSKTASTLICRTATKLDGKGTLKLSSEATAILLDKEAPLSIANISLTLDGKKGIEGVTGAERISFQNTPLTIDSKEVATKNLAAFEIDKSYKIIQPEDGKFDLTKKTIVDDAGRDATVLKIASRAVTGVTLQATITLKKGEVKQLTAAVAPSYAANKTLWWDSNKPQLVIVDRYGNIVGLEVGEATVTVTTAEGNKSAECKVIVVQADMPPTPKPKPLPNAVEEATLTGIQIAPNPFIDLLRITTKATPLTYKLVSMQGVVLRVGTIDTEVTQIDTSTIPAGIYILGLTSENGTTKTYRIIKQ